jgi:hypothetical protein
MFRPNPYFRELLPTNFGALHNEKEFCKGGNLVELSLYHYKHAAWQAVKHGIIVEARAGKRAAAQTHYSQALYCTVCICV